MHVYLVSLLNHAMKFHELKQNVASLVGNFENRITETIELLDVRTIQSILWCASDTTTKVIL